MQRKLRPRDSHNRMMALSMFAVQQSDRQVLSGFLRLSASSVRIRASKSRDTPVFDYVRALSPGASGTEPLEPQQLLDLCPAAAVSDPGADTKKLQGPEQELQLQMDHNQKITDYRITSVKPKPLALW